MSNDQAEEIKQQIDRVYKDLFNDAQAREKRHNEIHQEMLEKIEQVAEQVAPINQVFTSGSGFISITILILKGLGLLGVGVGVIYTFIKFLKT
jgi:hypothetical protein